jgi:predicted esterase
MEGLELGKRFHQVLEQHARGLHVMVDILEAPERAMTYLGGESSPAWFDLDELPVSTESSNNGLRDAVAEVHSLMRRAERDGIPASRIVLGGVDQGGALALEAGLTYERMVAGIVALSAWLPSKLNTELNVQRLSIPILMCHLGEDTVVPSDLSSSSYHALKAGGYTCCFGGDVFDELEAFVFQKMRKGAGQHTCPLAHTLVRDRAPPGKDSCCDTCGKAVRSREVLWGCRICNYDRCQRCMNLASCPEGHALEYQFAPDSGACDVCGKTVSEGDVLWGCRQCNYDRCEQCMRVLSFKLIHSAFGLTSFLDVTLARIRTS